MCEITSENFFSELPAIEAAIKESSFVSLDMEFSKLHENISNPFSCFDSAEERYWKIKEKVSDISCIQLGLATFCHDINKKTFKTTAYSFFTYPQTFYKSDSVVNFQSSCVEFLCKHKFDFNKLFHKSMSYLTDEQESTIKSEMEDALFFDKYFEANSKFRAIEEELYKVLNSVSEWYDDANNEENIVLAINGCNEPVFITLMEYYLVKQFKYVTIDEDREGLIITKIDEEKASKLLNNQIYENLKLNLLRKMMGIKYVLKLVSKWKKPIVGHNCALDVLILCNQFFKPLPKSFNDYKNFMHSNFGPIYDTKLMCQEIKILKFKDGHNWFGSSLSELYSYLKEERHTLCSNFLCIELPDKKKEQNMEFHHAGWDAYFTGYCFAQMIQIIKKNSVKNKDLTDQMYTLIELFKSIDFYKNKLYTYRSVSKTIDLNPNDHQNQIDYYLIIQNKGVLYKKLDLVKLKVDLKQIAHHIDIKLLSNYSVLIASPTEVSHDRIANGLKSKYKVEKYSHYQKRILKLQIVGFTLGIICTSTAVVMYLKK